MPEEGRPDPEPCPRCLGTGFELRTGEDGVERARPCSCRDSRREHLLLKEARVPRRYEHCSFENFEKGHHRTLPRALSSARNFVERYPMDEGGLLFSGPCGTGKTHLVVSIVHALVLERGVRCLFYDFQDLLKEIQSSFSPVKQTSEMDILQPVFLADVLVLDDLGAQKPTAWVRDTVGHIINNRYNNRRTTLFTTNRREGPPEGAPAPGRHAAEATLAEQIGERVHSRIYEMCNVIELDGEDYRKKLKHLGLRSQMERPSLPGKRR